CTHGTQAVLNKHPFLGVFLIFLGFKFLSMNNVEPEKWLRYVIEHIQDWPANRVRDLLPWKVDLSSQ
ncbi:transposase domain-containing protein, partial [Escherichia coli]|uniref:transposase domain-containing protein n=2 Tax=Escherichia coli TaxID=562 RepID=UPI00201CECF9